MLTPEEQDELQRLVQAHIPIRAMTRRLNRDVKTIRRALGRLPRPSVPAPSKLAPYHALITERVQQGLRAPRILREIRERGYTGGLTILKDVLRTLRPPQPSAPRAFHRFETGLAEEAQSDWSPYRVPIATRETIVHAFSLILCYSRRLFVAFFRDERLPTLLWAHQAAFRYHHGLCRRIAYDIESGWCAIDEPRRCSDRAYLRGTDAPSSGPLGCGASRRPSVRQPADRLYRSGTTTPGDGHAAFSQEHDKRPVGVRPEPSRASEHRNGRASTTTFQLRWPVAAPRNTLDHRVR